MIKGKQIPFLILLKLFAIVKAVNFENNGIEKNELINYRLPTSIIPINYELTLNFLPELTFRGTVKIKAIVQEKTNKIVLHYGKLSIKGVSVLHKKEQLIIENKNYDPITEKYSITLKNVLSKESEIFIVIVYSGEAHDDLKGFYKMTYFNQKGEEKKMAATQFSPIYARHAFPCFDEPAFKAFFKIRIRRPSNFIALSNMPRVNSTEVLGSNQLDIFQESVKMSTYLVGFVIGELNSTNTKNIKIWTREDLTDQTNYAEQISTNILNNLGTLFKQPLIIKKMDMIALPQMYFTAMENWGLVTFRESALLYDKKESSVIVQKTIAETIVHEFTHMWFGNLVTPNWWGYLWLKEAFAGYYQFRYLDEIESKWRMKKQILLNRQNALLIDSHPLLSKPMSRNVHTSQEVIGMFDSISYDKGLSIIRMMDLSFGTKVLDSALTLYLQSKKEKNSKPEDLFASMQLKMNSNLDTSVETIMNTWTKQSGYPVLLVTIDKNQVKLRQMPFSLGKLNANSTLNKKWWIPISWISQSTPSSGVNRWINDDEVITIDNKKNDWIIFNVEAAGFYRVNYDTVSWRKIIETLNSCHFKNILPLNRAAIIDDLLNLARANLVDYTLALEGLQYLRREKDYIAFKIAFNSLDYLTKKMSNHTGFDIYTKYLLRLIKDIHTEVGFNDKRDDDMTKMLLRRELNSISCNLGQEDCVNKSLRHFDQWKNGVNARVHRNLKTVVYATAIKKGDIDNWHFLWNKYNATNVVSERMEIFNALSCSPHYEILDKHLRSFLFKTNGHRMYHEHNLKDVFSSILSCSLFGVEFVINFIDENYEKIFKAGNVQQISSILLQVSQYLSTQTLIDKFEALVRSHNIDLEPIISSLQVQLEFAKHDLELYHQSSMKIINWLKSNKLINSDNVNYIISE
ncbi:aminopeptidase N-like isoform X2 [Leptopilina boulardi]|uniref:aminopeptidase N-like isoform X2 n=1 Tax=Leptopilina boulardi TaxID=63433 RepID=UPI0021F5DB9B|nr:aminopeptidase N-like isoform X2 [Leptopilina boulardi]